MHHWYRLLAVIRPDGILALPLYREGLSHGCGDIIELNELHHTFIDPDLPDLVPFRLCLPERELIVRYQ